MKKCLLILWQRLAKKSFAEAIKLPYHSLHSCPLFSPNLAAFDTVIYAPGYHKYVSS